MLLSRDVGCVQQVEVSGNFHKQNGETLPAAKVHVAKNLGESEGYVPPCPRRFLRLCMVDMTNQK